MTSKRCNRCEETKPDEDFYFSKRKGQYVNPCKECVKSERKKRYRDDSSGARDLQLARNKRRKEDKRAYVKEYLKTHPCVDCGNPNPLVLHFDHRDGEEKVSSVGNMIQTGWPVSSLAKEIEKCDVRCANCHAIRTAKQHGWSKLLWEDELNDKD